MLLLLQGRLMERLVGRPQRRLSRCTWASGLCLPAAIQPTQQPCCCCWPPCLLNTLQNSSSSTGTTETARSCANLPRVRQNDPLPAPAGLQWRGERSGHGREEAAAQLPCRVPCPPSSPCSYRLPAAKGVWPAHAARRPRGASRDAGPPGLLQWQPGRQQRRKRQQRAQPGDGLAAQRECRRVAPQWTLPVACIRALS